MALAFQYKIYFFFGVSIVQTFVLLDHIGFARVLFTLCQNDLEQSRLCHESTCKRKSHFLNQAILALFGCFLIQRKCKTWAFFFSFLYFTMRQPVAPQAHCGQYTAAYFRHWRSIPCISCFQYPKPL